MITKNELKDVALFSIAYSMLEYDDGDDKYITKQITADLERLKNEMFDILQIYKSESKRIMNIIDKVHHAVAVKKGNFCITAPQLALSLLCLFLPPNEHKFKKLCEPLTNFWAKNEELIRSIIIRANDGKYENYAESSEQIAYIYIENI
ncbi:hypothetical protein ACHJH3_08505 [Campylobacter sp. MOP7]|uniref:hypothetical protein n=1 Tax=Campylobacter canis TaxID=3378588 RepID=UPI00387E6E8F